MRQIHYSVKSILMLMLMLIFVYGIAAHAAGVSFSENFDRADGDVGNDWVIENPASGTWSIESNRLKLVDEQILHDPILIRDISTSHPTYISCDFEPLTGGVNAEARMWLKMLDRYPLRINMNLNSSNDHLFYYSDGQWVDSGFTLSRDTVSNIVMSLNWFRKTFDIVVNGRVVVRDKPFGEDVDYVTDFLFSAQGSASSGTFYWDNLYIDNNSFTPGECVLFNARMNDGDETDIYLLEMPASLHTPVNLTADVGGDCTIPARGSALSPDGAQILFNSTESGHIQVYVMDIDGTNKTQITNDPDDPYGPYSLGWYDEDTVMYRSSTGPGSGRVRLVDIDGTNDQLLIDIPFQGEGSIDHAALSPDGSKIIVEAQVGSWSPTTDLYIVDADGVSNGAAFYQANGNNNIDRQATWSSDSFTIYWSHENSGGVSDLFSIVRKTLDSTYGVNDYDEVIVPEQSGMSYDVECLSPDDNQLLYRNNSQELVIIDLATKQEQVIASAFGMGAAYWGVSPVLAGDSFGDYCLYFDGVDDRLQLDASVLDGMGEYTIEFLFKMDNTPGIPHTLISAANSTNQNELLLYYQDDTMHLNYKDPGGSPAALTASTGGILGDDNWHHLALVRNATDIIIYLDGYLLVSALGVTPDTLNVEGLWIGGDQDVVNGGWESQDFFTGYFDELRIWSVAKSEAEMQSAAFASVSPSATGLTAYWRFEEGVGSISTDITSNGYIADLDASGDGTSDPATAPSWIRHGGTSTKPDKPINIYPVDGKEDTSLTPTLAASNFSDVDTEDYHLASKWQIVSVPGDYSSPVYEVVISEGTLTSTIVPVGFLQQGVTYFWHVQYQDSKGLWSEWSIETSFTPVVCSIPAPVNFKAVSGADSVQLNWDPVIDASLVGYNLYRDNDTTPGLILVNSIPITGTFYTDEDVEVETTYDYYLTALGGLYCESDPSESVTASSGSIIVTMPDFRGAPGKEVTLQINTEHATGIAGNGMDVQVTYDAAHLTPVLVETTALTDGFMFLDNSEVASGQLNISGISLSGATIVGKGHLLDIKFRVTESLPEGTSSSLAFVTVNMFDRNLQSLAVDYSDTAVFTVAIDYILGDPTGDGAINSADALFALQVASGEVVPTAIQLLAMDINGDGEITAADVTMLQRMIVGLPINPGIVGGRDSKSIWPFVDNNNYQIKIRPTFIKEGQTADALVQLDKFEGMAGLDLWINYDPSVAVFTGATLTETTAGFVLNAVEEGNVIKISMSSKEALGVGSGAVLLLGFQAVGEFNESSPLAISRFILSGVYGEDLSWKNNVSKVDGYVKIVLDKNSAENWTAFE